jgi:hypothetical protein
MSTEFTARRITRKYCQTIQASPDQVFPLLCPVREADWLDGWKYTMVLSGSGLVEDQAVFTTPGAGEPDTVWIVTRHDAAHRAVEFVRFTPGSHVCVLHVDVTPDDPGRSRVHIAYTYTSTSAAGNAFIDRFTEETFLRAVAFWENSMNHWFATGKRLARSE